MNKAALASVRQLESEPYQAFMQELDEFALVRGLRSYRRTSKEWEAPWLLFNGFPYDDCRILDIGSGLSPIPWYLGQPDSARVSLVETHVSENAYAGKWNSLMNERFDYQFVDDETIPYPDETFDLVLSISVIEHQHNKTKAIDEVIRVLKPGGTFAISLDIVEQGWGMTTPEDEEPLTLKSFEQWIWSRPEFGNKAMPYWNLKDISGFLAWHTSIHPSLNYVVGAAILKKV